MKTQSFSIQTASLFFISFIFFLSSCGSKEKNSIEPEYRVDETTDQRQAGSAQATQQAVDDEIVKTLRAEGMQIQTGTDPLDLDGEYAVDAFSLAVAFDSEDLISLGIPSQPYRIRIRRGTFQNQVSLELVSTNGDDYGLITDAKLNADGSKFTVSGSLHLSGESNETYKIVLSGERRDEAIKGMELAVIRIRKPDSRMPRKAKDPTIAYRLWKTDLAAAASIESAARKAPARHQIFASSLVR